MWKIKKASSWISYHLRVWSDVERKHCCSQRTQELRTHPQGNEVRYIVIQIPKELHQGDWIFPKPRAFFLWLPGLGWETNTRLAQTAALEYLPQKGRARFQACLKQETNHILQRIIHHKLKCVPCHVITQKYWQTWPDWSQPKMWWHSWTCLVSAQDTAQDTAHGSEHVWSVSKQVRTKHNDQSPAERQNMWQEEWVLQQVHLSRRCFWTCYLGRNMQAIQPIIYTYDPTGDNQTGAAFQALQEAIFSR